MTDNKLIAEFMEFKQCKGIRSESGKYFDYWAKENFSCIEEQEIQIESEWGFGLVEQDLLFVEDLKFHSDWNWLMQVVDKIESIDDGEYDVNILKNGTQIINYRAGGIVICDNVGQISYSEKIEHVYQAVVNFIKWYNKQR